MRGSMVRTGRLSTPTGSDRLMESLTARGWQDDMTFAELESLDLSALPAANRALLENLKREDYLGFDTPSEAIATVFSDDLSGFDISEGLRTAVKESRMRGDQEALDYYDTPVKHWTRYPWEQIDMDKVDAGLHSDPTPTGDQALDRRATTLALSGPGEVDEIKDMRIHVGNELVAEDLGKWDEPQVAFDAISNALRDDNWELAEQFEDTFRYNLTPRVSTIKGDPQAVEEMQAMRQWLLDNDYQTIRYANAEEGVGRLTEQALASPDWKAYEAAQNDKIRDLDYQIARLDPDSPEAESLEEQRMMLDDELEYARDDLVREAEEGNFSYISLDPGNVRSSDAAFSRDKIGQPDMMGSATTPMMGLLAGMGATGSVLASQTPSENLSQGWEALKGLPQMLLEDAKAGAEGLHYGLTGDRINAPIPQLNEETPLGNAIAQDVGNYISNIDLNPFPGEYTVGQGIEDVAGLYNQYVKPNLSERQEAGLGGGAMLASMIGLPKGSVTRSSPHLKRVGDVDTVDSLDVRTEGGDLVEAQKVDPESLIGRPFVSNMADNSVGDRSVITRIDGVDIPGVTREGGYDYSRQPQNVADGRLWASERGAVTGILNAANEAAALPGARGKPLMLPWGMSPAGSSDFAQFSADLGVQHAQRALDQGTVNRLDERILTGNGKGVLGPVRSWQGLQNATPEYLTALGGKRKNVLAALDAFRDEGTLNISQIRQAVGDAEATLGYRPAGLLRVGEIDTSRGVLDNSMHQTYSKGVPGTYIGNLNPGASILDVPSAQLRSGINLRDKYGPLRGSKLPTPQGKAMQSNVIGVLDERTIEEWIRRGVFD